MKRVIWLASVGLAVLLAVGVAVAHNPRAPNATRLAASGDYGPGHGPGYGPGMMWGYGPGYGPGSGYGPGYGGGHGPGMMWGYGPGAEGSPAQGNDGASDGAQGSSSPSGAIPGSAVVEMQGLRFVPGTLQVTAGTTVTYVNRDPVPHDVVNLSPDDLTATRAFASPVLAPGQSWSHTFTQSGTYPILCSVDDHYAAGMVGEVTVVAAPADAGNASGATQP